MNLLPHLAIFFFWSVLPAHARISCMDDRNKPVDWYAIYKMPKSEHENEKLMLGRGESYAYLKTYGYRKYKWILSEKGVSDSDSMLGNTLNAFYDNKKNLTYLLYNDEKAVESPDAPVAVEDEATFGHTKGVLAFDEDTGFWLVHSVPKFPPEDTYSYPESGLMYGQSALCITFPTKELNEIGKQLLFNYPNIYSKGHTKVVINSLDENVKSLFGRKPQFVKKEPFSRIATLKSLRNVKFTSFAKDARFGKDLYDGLVATYLKTPLFVETWRNGAGTPLPPSCDIRYEVKDIKSINITVSETPSGRFRPIAFSSTDDHSKWAVSSQSNSSWVCVGDINRMKSQWTRGGGTVCFNSPAASSAYRKTIQTTDHCAWPRIFWSF